MCCWRRNTLRSSARELLYVEGITKLISGFLHDVNWICTLLEFRDISEQPAGCPEASFRNYHSALRKIPEQCRYGITIYRQYGDIHTLFARVIPKSKYISDWINEFVYLKGVLNIWHYSLSDGPPLWSSGQSFWLQIQRSRVRFPALQDFSE